ncbi:MAG: protein adenylyltransferase SelO [Nitritalea sp.]
MPTVEERPFPGFHWDTSFEQLPSGLYSRQDPSPVHAPKLRLWNSALARSLDFEAIDFQRQEEVEQLAAIFSGNQVPLGARPLAQAYAGHQFGNFTKLGDGRALLLGEHLSASGQRVDVQLKGAGITPYSRGGDGRATRKAMLREYLISEAMHALGVPSSRSLAVVETGEKVWRQEKEAGAVLTRVMSSHLRVGTFQYARHFLDKKALQALLAYTIERHYPELREASNPALALLEAVMERQIALVVHWLRVGFIHGVMNTDNMSICGETFDYGPCAFLNAYDPATVFSSIDTQGRYAFGNQPGIAQWNLAALAGALLPLIDADEKQATERCTTLLNDFPRRFTAAQWDMYAQKMGFSGRQAAGEGLLQDFLALLKQYRLDYTQAFLDLGKALQDQPHAFPTALEEFLQTYKSQLLQQSSIAKALELMGQVNPQVIPRNYIVERALYEADQEDDFTLFEAVLKRYLKPYMAHDEDTFYQFVPEDADLNYQTFCGT